MFFLRKLTWAAFLCPISVLPLVSTPVFAESKGPFSSEAFSAKTVVQLHLTHVDGVDSYLERGTGQTRYDEHDSIELGQLLTEINWELSSNTSLHGVVAYQTEQEIGLGASQFYLQYKPILSRTWRPRFKVGAFYPEMSFENTRTGWLSPYTYSFSAINSWLAEEQRTVGAEAHIDYVPNGRKGHTFGLTAALFKGNDTLGTMLAWRGWALHDRQTHFNESVFFARYPSIGPDARLARQAAWVEPFRELDGRFGAYFGAHWKYQSRSQLKLFYYDNRGDNSIRAQRGDQWPWDTHYFSLAGMHRFNKNFRILGQWMSGSTEIGDNAVKFDFSAGYLMANYRTAQYSLSARFDVFETDDTDEWLTDINDGDGTALTLSGRYFIDKNWHVGLEYSYLDTDRTNRTQWPGRSAEVTQKQLLGVLEYQF